VEDTINMTDLATLRLAELKAVKSTEEQHQPKDVR
jgi:hypothetical protein